VEEDEEEAEGLLDDLDEGGFSLLTKEGEVVVFFADPDDEDELCWRTQ
jgi:hypothetical protein